MRRRPTAGAGTAGPSPVPPHPELKRRMRERLDSIRSSTNGELGALTNFLRIREPTGPGLNDGMLIPGTEFPVGTSLQAVRRASLGRAPLRGGIRVIVVLVDFDDRQLTRRPADIQELFFSIGTLEHGSVREYYREVSNGLVDIEGEVVGPFRMPRTLAEYAHGESGMGTDPPNARTMARDAAVAASRDVDFTRYDNDADGYVDAFVVIHAGGEAAVTGRSGDIWAHKWVLAGGALPLEEARVFAYLTVAENCRVGVCCHELGHLLFGWPDLHDVDGRSEGLGRWCLMAGGSWNGDGDVPAHPSAWCKSVQGWVTVVNQTSNGVIEVPEVKDTSTVFRLWDRGHESAEYFLVENRLRDRFDAELPGEGLLVYHVDDSMEDNSNGLHYRVGLLQADGARDLESATNRGDAGDSYPGNLGNAGIDDATTPGSRSFAGLPTSVSIADIPAPGAKAIVRVTISSDGDAEPEEALPIGR